ncbi:MAG: hypothetical protein H6713_42215 [Myxococcales bacterium]|nr:hypothetical protein [Myxococcales bacterium]
MPTFAEFMPRFFQDHVLANRLSPTTQLSYASTINNHLMPVLADVRLDRVAARHTQALKRAKASASTVNRVLKHLKLILNAASRWGFIERVPEIKLLKQPERQPVFYDFGDYRRLVSAAAGLGANTLTAVRLGGDAGLRCGEMLGLRWANVHLERGKLLVCDNLVRTGEGDWILRVPKGGRPRWVPISAPLRKALSALERRGEHVIACRTGRHLVRSTLTRGGTARLSVTPASGKLVCMSFSTFCSQLVLRVTIRTIRSSPVTPSSRPPVRERSPRLTSGAEQPAAGTSRGQRHKSASNTSKFNHIAATGEYSEYSQPQHPDHPAQPGSTPFPSL